MVVRVRSVPDNLHMVNMKDTKEKEKVKESYLFLGNILARPTVCSYHTVPGLHHHVPLHALDGLTGAAHVRLEDLRRWKLAGVSPGCPGAAELESVAHTVAVVRRNHFKAQSLSGRKIRD